MEVLQILIQPIERVSIAIIVDTEDLAAEVISTRQQRCARSAAFVDVVAHVDEEVQVLREHVPVRGVVARREVLAARESKAHLRHALPGSRERTCAADAAARTHRLKLVPVPGVRLEIGNRDMRCVTALGQGERDGRVDRLDEAAIPRDPPLHRYGAMGHAAAVERIRRAA